MLGAGECVSVDVGAGTLADRPVGVARQRLGRIRASRELIVDCSEGLA